jgi:MFS family permease
MQTSQANSDASGWPGRSWAAVTRLASTAEGRIVGLGGFVEGFVLVTFAAGSAVLTGTHTYALTNGQYGAVIMPEAAAAIVTSLIGFGLTRRDTTRQAYRAGLALGLLSMILLLASAVVHGHPAAAFALLLIASASLGAGFGMTVPVLTAYARFLHATAEDTSVIVMHAQLALGALVAPGVAKLLVGLGIWWVYPALSALLLIILLLLSERMPTRVGAPRVASGQARRRIARFSLYAICIMVYSLCVSVVVIWSELPLIHHLRFTKVPPGVPKVHLVSAVSLVDRMPGLHNALVFAAFWGGLLTVGRVAFAVVDRWRSSQERIAAYFVPILALTSIVATCVLLRNGTPATIAIFGLAGLGCSALLPLDFSADQKDVTAISAALVGGVAAYQLGFGAVAAGLLPHQHAPLGILLFFAAAVVVGMPMVVMAFAAVSRRPGLPDRPEAAAATRAARARR